MKTRLVQIALSLALLGLVVQIVLIAPSQIRDTETKAAVLPAPDVTVYGTAGIRVAPRQVQLHVQVKT